MRKKRDASWINKFLKRGDQVNGLVFSLRCDLDLTGDLDVRKVFHLVVQDFAQPHFADARHFCYVSLGNFLHKDKFKPTFNLLSTFFF